MRPARIIFADIDQDYREKIETILSAEGMEVVAVPDGLSVLIQFREWPADLVIVNYKLPALSGVEICRRIKRVTNRAVIILVEQDAERQMEEGFAAGADDCIEKWVQISELLWRVKKLINSRSTSRSANSYELVYNNFVLDTRSRRVVFNGRTIEITPLEYRLLRFLITHQGKVVSKENIFANVWGCNPQNLKEPMYQNLIEAVICRLRKKIEFDPTHTRYLHTIWGIGYQFGEMYREDY